MSAVAEKLREARGLIAKGWTQGAYCRDAQGNSHIVGSDPSAVSWCAVGSLDKAFHGEPEQWRRAVDVLYDSIGAPLARWNDEDGRTQGEVLAAFDKAIELAEQVSA